MEKYACLREECGKAYKKVGALRKHQREVHRDEALQVGKLVCPVEDCRRRFPFITKLCTHVRIDHQTPESVIESMSFNTFDEFTEWKLQLEKSTTSSYVQHEAAKMAKSKKHKNIYFYCHRSGQSCKKVPSVTENRNRSIKSQGLCKIDGTCTAHISVTVDAISAAVFIKFCTLHVGHDMELAHLRLSTDTRLEIAALLNQGITIDQIMDTMRDRHRDDTSVQRDHLLRRRDILNVMTQFNVGCKRKNPNDHSSVDVLVEALRATAAESPTVVYELQDHDYERGRLSHELSTAVDDLEALRQRSTSLCHLATSLISECDNKEALLCFNRQTQKPKSATVMALKRPPMRRKTASVMIISNSANCLQSDSDVCAAEPMLVGNSEDVPYCIAVEEVLA